MAEFYDNNGGMYTGPLSPRSAQAIADSYGWYSPNSNVAKGDFDDWFLDKTNFKHAWLDTTDAANVWRQERTNYYNQLQWQATNAWNLMMWEAENEYNSPSASMERLLQAGINPIWAMSDAPAANAQQLTAGLPTPNGYAPATYDLAKMANERSISSEANSLNSMLGFGNLDLGYSRLELDKSVSKSAISKTRAETRLLNTQIESQAFLNKINFETYDTQVRLKQTELDQALATISNLESNTQLTDAQKELLSVTKEKEKALKLQIEAMTKKVESETFDKLDNLRNRWYEAYSHRIQANASTMSAQAAMEQVQVAQKQYQLSVDDAEHRWENASNAQIIDYINATKGKQHWLLGYNVNDIESTDATGLVKFTQKGHNPVAEMQALGMVVYKRAKNNPTSDNLRVVDEYNKALERFNPREPYFLNSLTPANTSVQNPSDSWNQ